MHRHAERLPREIPERLIDAAEGRTGDGATPEEEATIALLPEEFDALRVRADQPRFEVSEQPQHRPWRGAERRLANPVEPRIGLDLHVDSRATGIGHQESLHGGDTHGTSSHQRAAQPLIAPLSTPRVKYFCKKG